MTYRSWVRVPGTVLTVSVAIAVSMLMLGGSITGSLVGKESGAPANGLGVPAKTNWAISDRSVSSDSPPSRGLISASLFNISFVESGLPSGTLWNVTVNQTTSESTGSTISFELPNGSYSYSIAPVLGLTASPPSGNVTVAGANQTISGSFYSCSDTVGEIAGEPTFAMFPGTTQFFNWTIINYGSCSLLISVELPDIESMGGFPPPTMTAYPSTLILPAGGEGVVELNVTMPDTLGDIGSQWVVVVATSVQVACGAGACISGGVAKVARIYEVFPFQVTFDATGLAKGSVWSITDGGSTNSTAQSSASLLLGNGSSTFVATSSTGGTVVGDIDIQGNALSVPIAFCRPSHCDATFVETGLAPGTTWSVTVNGATTSSASDQIEFPEADGSYSYTVVPVSGYFSPNSSGSFSLIGKSTTFDVDFEPVTFAAVSLQPENVSLATGESVTLTATPECRLGACPAGGTSAWSVVPATLGSLNSSSFSSVTFTALQRAGDARVFVNMSLLGVTQEATGWITIEKSKISVSVATGAQPYGLAFDPRNKDIYVASIFANSVNVISTSSNAVVDKIPVGTSPEGLAYDSGMNEIFVTNAGSGNVSVINASTNTVVANIPVGTGPSLPGYDGATGDVYVPLQGGGGLATISDVTNSVISSYDVGPVPGSVAVDAGAGVLFVGDNGASTVNAVSATDPGSTLWTATVGYDPNYVAYDPATQEVFSSDLWEDSVCAISAKTGSSMGCIPVDFPPVGIAVDSQTGELFVGGATGAIVDVISVLSNTVVGSFHVGSSPQMALFDASSGKLYVSNLQSANVSVVSPVGIAAEYSVKFTEKGLASGTDWCIEFYSATQCATTGSLEFSGVPNGTYAYVVQNLAGYRPSNSYLGSLSVAGVVVGSVAVKVTVPFSAIPAPKYRVQFVETGLAPSSLWQVTLGPTTKSSTGDKISFSVTNGSYTFSVDSPSTSYAYFASDPLPISGAAVVVNLEF